MNQNLPVNKTDFHMKGFALGKGDKQLGKWSVGWFNFLPVRPLVGWYANEFKGRLKPKHLFNFTWILFIFLIHSSFSLHTLDKLGTM